MQVINAVLKKHMKIVREAIFHAPVKGNNLRTCCTPEIPNSENSLARFLAFLFALLNFVINMQGRFGCFEGNYPAQASAEIFSIKTL